MKVWAETKYDIGSQEIRKVLELEGFDVTKESPEIVFVLGGDGTFYRSARTFPNSALLLVRSSSFGALAEIEEKEMKYAIDKIRTDQYRVENAMRLEMQFKDKKTWGLNDVIVFRDDESANRFRVYCDKQEVFKGRMVGDGIIASTPLGSTGYNWSAGGPVLNGDEKEYLITPMDSLYLDKTIVVNGRRVLQKVEETKRIPDHKEVILEFERPLKNKITPDGRQAERIFIDVEKGDQLYIRKAKEFSKFVRLR